MASVTSFSRASSSLQPDTLECHTDSGEQQPGPEALRRLAYLRQTELALRAGTVTLQPYSQSESHQHSVVLHKPEVRRKDSLALGSPRTLAHSSSPAAGQFAFLTMGNTFLCQTLNYFRVFVLACLVLFFAVNALYIASVVAFGHPSRLPWVYSEMGGAVAQGFRCGWTKEVSNPYTCR